MSDLMVNKVAESGLVTLDLEDFYPDVEVVAFDLKDFLFMGLILKEKDFREALRNVDWEVYRNTLVGVHCSADAIIPMWAYMLVASYLSGVANGVKLGNATAAAEEVVVEKIRLINAEEFSGQRVVVKGCGEKKIGEKAYLEISMKLLPVVKSIMYGEPCSTVPVFKRK